jgi:hypothetical protein
MLFVQYVCLMSGATSAGVRLGMLGLLHLQKRSTYAPCCTRLYVNTVPLNRCSQRGNRPSLQAIAADERIVLTYLAGARMSFNDSMHAPGDCTCMLYELAKGKHV